MHGVPLTRPRGQLVLHPSRDEYLDVVRALRDEGYLVCVDVTGVDYLTHPGRNDLPPGVTPERFEVVVNLLNHGTRSRIRLRVQVPEDDCRLPSLWELYPGTEAAERETFDMFGIVFDGHPDLTRILMPEDWIGHPLRKDYDSGRIPVQFKATAERPHEMPDVRGMGAP
jgi:NADH-quinone oxidoreductase subunit C